MIRQLLERPTVLVLIPVYNDWESLELLLKCIDHLFEQEKFQAEVLVVDDASILPISDSLKSASFQAINKISVLGLRRNLGHQRAIAIGLAYVEAKIDCKAVIVMDGDGEDAPKDILKLIDKCIQERYTKIVFARRSQRSESRTFKIFYLLYKGLYKLLTGQFIRVGNFSLIPYTLLHKVVVVSEIWNHYAAGVLKAKIPYTEVPSKRNHRLSGNSKMSFVSLVIHGLSAISVFGDIVGVRLLVASCLLILFNLCVIAVVLILRFTTTLAIPGWTSYIVAVFFVLIMQAIMISLFFIFVVLSGRNYSSFLPQRDYHHFVLENREIFSKL